MYAFISPMCPHSGKLIQLIKKNENLYNKIRFVDASEKSDLYPSVIENGSIYRNQEAFKWVQLEIDKVGVKQVNGDKEKHPESMPTIEKYTERWIKTPFKFLKNIKITINESDVYLNGYYEII